MTKYIRLVKAFKDCHGIPILKRFTEGEKYEVIKENRTNWYVTNDKGWTNTPVRKEESIYGIWEEIEMIQPRKFIWADDINERGRKEGLVPGQKYLVLREDDPEMNRHFVHINTGCKELEVLINLSVFTHSGRWNIEEENISVGATFEDLKLATEFVNSSLMHFTKPELKGAFDRILKDWADNAVDPTRNEIEELKEIHKMSVESAEKTISEKEQVIKALSEIINKRKKLTEVQQDEIYSLQGKLTHIKNIAS
jgi:hypothetical protein